MNAQSKFIGMKNTHFNDPSGLSQHNTATADDLFAMLQYIYKHHSELLDITDKKSVRAAGHYWENKNKLKKFDPYYIGGKTGYTSAAKQTGIGVFEVPVSGGSMRTLGIVILGSGARGNDITKLIQYIQKHIHFGDQESIKTLYEETEL
jgi:D-alanyl-D-alanine carboxypeptidase